MNIKPGLTRSLGKFEGLVVGGGIGWGGGDCFVVVWVSLSLRGWGRGGGEETECWHVL